ncbi:MAG: hypothetical protein CME06_14355 [Gemmatimonadetes bacterium]|nr:hypothetical protein [Gemmatimonadota bacterium]
MKIGPGSTPHAAYQASLKAAEGERKDRDRAGPSRADSVKISSEARKKLDDLETARTFQARMPDLSFPRGERIREIEQRIESGHYDSPAISREISDLLLSIFGPQQPS